MDCDDGGDDDALVELLAMALKDGEAPCAFRLSTGYRFIKSAESGSVLLATELMYGQDLQIKDQHNVTPCLPMEE